MSEELKKVDVLYSYIVKTDTGFAPNPFHGFCTLACCKPIMRRKIRDYIVEKYKKNYLELNGINRKPQKMIFSLANLKIEKGDDYKKFIESLNIWVVGLAGKDLKVKGAVYSILYAMKVTDVLTFSEYWNCPRFSTKKVDIKNDGEFGHNNDSIVNCGDNIYNMNEENDTDIQQKSFHRPSEKLESDNMKTDLSGECVLISDKYVYFGNSAETQIKPLIKGFDNSKRGHRIHSHNEKKDNAISGINELIESFIVNNSVTILGKNHVLGMPAQSEINIRKGKC